MGGIESHIARIDGVEGGYIHGVPEDDEPFVVRQLGGAVFSEKVERGLTLDPALPLAEKVLRTDEERVARAEDLRQLKVEGAQREAQRRH